MLILTRPAGEIIVITTLSGEHIEVVVLGMKGSQIRIGTSAPAEFPIVTTLLKWWAWKGSTLRPSDYDRIRVLSDRIALVSTLFESTSFS